jgi:lysozyme
MKLGKRGDALIKSYEKLRLKAYRPTRNDVPTIGWGHTKGVKMGDTCTTEQADAWFLGDVASAERIVDRLKVKLTQSMYDALVSLAYNCGTLGESIPKSLKAGDYYLACQHVFLWRKQEGEDLLGLARRRALEMCLFLEDGMP